MNEYLIGRAIGSFVVLLAVSSAVLFVNRARKQNPTPYLAAGAICGILGLCSAANDDAPFAPAIALYATLLALLWRYKKESGAAPSVAGRLNAVVHGVIFLSCLASSGSRGADGAAWFGVLLVVSGTIAKWVLMARKP